MSALPATKPLSHDEMLGRSLAMVELTEEFDHIAAFDARVLITGESGVGKELVARRIHTGSSRVARPFIAVNCAGLPDTLLESELFGHMKGSFTGAYRDKPGKLELAHEGTVFLDEIGDVSPRMQGLLLRFLETGELQKVGLDRAARFVDTRVVTATNRDLAELTEQGSFREDLFYRLNVIHLQVPPLRERKEDVPVLIEHFLADLNAGHGRRITIGPEAMACLLEYRWPGNVRELRNLVEQLVVTFRRTVVGPEDLPPAVRSVHEVVVRPKRERRKTVANVLFKRMATEGESFWTCAYPMYMGREITRANLRDIVRMGLELGTSVVLVLDKWRRIAYNRLRY